MRTEDRSEGNDCRGGKGRREQKRIGERRVGREEDRWERNRR